MRQIKSKKRVVIGHLNYDNEEKKFNVPEEVIKDDAILRMNLKEYLKSLKDIEVFKIEKNYAICEDGVYIALYENEIELVAKKCN